jgi:uncharacterized protein DUF2252
MLDTPTTAGPPAMAEERTRAGRALRQQVPRSSHGDVPSGPDRADPIALLEEQAASRVPELVPVRHGRMLESEFAFYRGAAIVMAADLAATPRTGITTQICGDAHLSNFGLFGSPERHLVFDLNDFDETNPGPWEWDVKRLAASVAVAARTLGFSDVERRAAVLATAGAYREEMRSLAGLGHLDAWYRHVDADELLLQVAPQLQRVGRRARQVVAKAHTRDSLHALGKLTRTVDGELRIVSNPPIVVPIEELVDRGGARSPEDVLADVIDNFRRTMRPDVRLLLSQYRLVHLAHKVVGVGSVGTRAWIALFIGRDRQDPLFLQAKEAQTSVVERFVPSDVEMTNGERVVVGQQVMQAVSDIFLGWSRTVGFDGVERDFYVRQLRDWKGSFDLPGTAPAGLALYGQLCGVTLARAHARSGDRFAIAGYLGQSPVFDRAIVEFADAYAERSRRDYVAFKAAVDSGRLAATPGV